MNLNEKQQEYFDLFDNNLQVNVSYIVIDNDRQWGKTTILNEIGLTYQALGYEVILLTKYPQANNHFATRYVSNMNDLQRINLDDDKIIAIVDEYDIGEEIIDCLQKYDVPIVGFI